MHSHQPQRDDSRRKFTPAFVFSAHSALAPAAENSGTPPGHISPLLCSNLTQGDAASLRRGAASHLLPVLYAEDEPDDAFFMKLAWEEAGVPNPLVLVKDGQEAVNYLGGVGHFADRQRFPLPWLLLLDLKLPFQSGFEVLRWLRQQPSLASLKVVIVSGSDFPSDRDHAQRLGALDYVVKPASPMRLVDIVRERYERWVRL